MGQKKENIHKGHRERMRQRILNNSMEVLYSYEILEQLLYYSVPRKDTNEIAHQLFNAFGSISAIFDAPIEELEKIPGVGQHSSILIKMIPELMRRYGMDKDHENILDSVEKVGKYLLPRYIGRKNETVTLVCMDIKCKVLNCQIIFEGNVNSAQISIRKIVTTALKYNACGVCIAHNHPGGVAVPSAKDIETTLKIQKALSMVEVKLLDHIVIAENDFVSMAQSSMLGTD